jgi:hypothetical protein
LVLSKPGRAKAANENQARESRTRELGNFANQDEEDVGPSSYWRVLFFCELACFMPNDDQDIRRSLARAFDRAWEGYYRSGRLTVSKDVARTELARRLVQLSKEDIRDEGSLTEAGLSHLRQLTLKGGIGF